MKKSILFILYNVFVVGILLTLIELTLTYFLENPEKIPEKLIPHFQSYYISSDRSIIQYEEDFAEYNNELFYTLKPGEFTFENREFENNFSINSKGLRDDEESLNAPDVIVLGDSYAMGWGVGQDATFAAVLEKDLDLKVLNAGISSYGTAREMKLLDQLDVSNIKTLVIQYCGNDIDENKSFYAHNNQLIISPKEEYQAAVEEAKETKNYFPMKHTISLGKSIFLPSQANSTENKTVSSENYLDTVSKSQSQVFMNALLHSTKIELIPQIIITSLDTEPNNYFLEELRSTLVDSNYSHLREKMMLLDLSEVLVEEDYYLLDRHIKAKTHRYIGSLIGNIIESKEISSDTAYSVYSVNSFDKKNEDWSYDQNLVNEGKYHMTAATEWGPTFRFNVTKDLLKEGFETITVNYDYFGKKDTTGMLVISIDQEGENLFWFGGDTDKSINKNKDSTGFSVKNQIRIDANLNSKIDSSAQVSVFYWNNKKQNLKLDNFSVGLRNKMPLIHRFQ